MSEELLALARQLAVACWPGEGEDGEERPLAYQFGAIIVELEAELGRLREAFRHTHVAKYDGRKLLDQCAECGLDIRDEIHPLKDPP